ncbi:MAG: hypothetical protein WCD11_35470 [Solirubrobacteraceae bacterium]
MKKTVPPVSLVPAGAVGWVRPKPLSGAPEGDAPALRLLALLLPPLPLLLLLLEPQAAVRPTTTTVARTMNDPRRSRPT